MHFLGKEEVVGSNPASSTINVSRYKAINTTMLHTFVDTILELTQGLGYFGIFLLTLAESTVLPVPSELVLLPAGVLCSKGQMNLFLLIATSTFGTLAGASVNYYGALKLGRPFMLKFGKFVLMPPSRFEKTEKFFVKYGEISTFMARLIPVARHFISLFAGLYRMNFAKFAAYTLCGGLIWCTILCLIGFFGGQIL